jgi:signal transduction histidine kinase
VAAGTARTRDQLLSRQAMGDAERARVALVTRADNGAVADKQVHVFERFYQVDGSARRRYEDIGLSLALVKEIVQAHGGQVALESEPERGSTFTIALPVAEESQSQKS